MTPTSSVGDTLTVVVRSEPDLARQARALLLLLAAPTLQEERCDDVEEPYCQETAQPLGHGVLGADTGVAVASGNKIQSTRYRDDITQSHQCP